MGRALASAVFVTFSLPPHLPPAISRPSLPSYFPDDPYQGVPTHGYTKLFEAALDHPNIKYRVNTDFFDLEVPADMEHIIFTGPIDQFFQQKRGSKLAALQYRSIEFTRLDVPNQGFGQPAFALNYPQFRDGKFTRCIDYRRK